jgi:hypothetical protein
LIRESVHHRSSAPDAKRAQPRVPHPGWFPLGGAVRILLLYQGTASAVPKGRPKRRASAPAVAASRRSTSTCHCGCRSSFFKVRRQCRLQIVEDVPLLSSAQKSSHLGEHQAPNHHGWRDQQSDPKIAPHIRAMIDQLGNRRDKDWGAEQNRQRQPNAHEISCPLFHVKKAFDQRTARLPPELRIEQWREIISPISPLSQPK